MLTLYTTNYCSDCDLAKRVLREQGVEYKEVSVTKNTEEGKRGIKEVESREGKVPLLVFEDESVLVEPTEEELVKKLSEEA